MVQIPAIYRCVDGADVKQIRFLGERCSRLVTVEIRKNLCDHFGHNWLPVVDGYESSLVSHMTWELANKRNDVIHSFVITSVLNAVVPVGVNSV